MMTFPATRRPAPRNQRGGRDSEKIRKPRMAVRRKLVEVLRIETCVVEVPRARALVKSVHWGGLLAWACG